MIRRLLTPFGWAVGAAIVFVVLFFVVVFVDVGFTPRPTPCPDGTRVEVMDGNFGGVVEFNCVTDIGFRPSGFDPGWDEKPQGPIGARCAGAFAVFRVEELRTPTLESSWQTELIKQF